MAALGTIEVAPLVCTRCGAPVPIGDDESSATCRACGTACVIPAAVSKLRATARAEAAVRARAQVLADDLSAPPGFFMRLWLTASLVTALGTALTLVVWLVVGIIICGGLIWSAGLDAAIVGFFVGLLLSIPLVYNEILHDVATLLRVDYADVLGGAGSYALLGFAFFTLLAVPSILGDYAESFEKVRATLRKVLSATPPRTGGGPSECRVCGAALEIVAGTLHARCMYCSADNLVDVPKELLERADEDAKTKHEHVESAHAEAETARTDGKRLALRRTGKAFLYLVAGFVIAGRIVAAINEDGSTFWARANPARLELRPRLSDNPTLPANATIPFEVTSTYDRCVVDWCEAFYFAALAPGDHFDLHTEGPLTFDRLEKRDIGKWYNPSYGWTKLEGPPPYTGWYRVVLRTPKRSRGKPTVFWAK